MKEKIEKCKGKKGGKGGKGGKGKRFAGACGVGAFDVVSVAVIVLCAAFVVGCGMEVGNKAGDSNVGSDNEIITDNSVRIEGGEDRDFEDDAKGENPDCSSETQGVDGALGFLWKPESDSTGNLAVLFPADYDIKFESVGAEVAGGSVEEGEFGGFSNGNRQTWRFDMEGVEYTGRLLVQDEAQECLWEVKDPGARQD